MDEKVEALRERVHEMAIEVARLRGQVSAMPTSGQMLWLVFMIWAGAGLFAAIGAGFAKQAGG